MARKRVKRLRKTDTQAKRFNPTVLILGLGFVALCVAAWWWNARSNQGVYDLSVVGEGVPVIVQVHDHNCHTCVQLQNNVKRAMNGFSEDELLYRIADLNRDEGTIESLKHGVGRTSLVLYDDQGISRGTIQGVQGVDTLRTAFQNLVDFEQ